MKATTESGRGPFMDTNRPRMNADERGSSGFSARTERADQRTEAFLD
jgi:hypothetical protein